MLPAQKDLSVYAGDTFTLTLRLRQRTADGLAGLPVDLTGATAKAQVRPTAGSSTVSAEFTCAVPTGTDGLITITLDKTQTASLTGGVWDVEVHYPDTSVSTLISGNVTVVPQVTR